MDCELCELSKVNKPVSGCRFSNVDTTAPIDVVVIGDFPHEDDVKFKKPFSGKLGSVLAKVLTSAGFSITNVYVTTLVKCRPEAPNHIDGRIKKSHVTSCAMYLMEELAEIQPKLVILLGDSVFKYFYPEKTFSDFRGKILTHTDTGLQTITTYHVLAMLASSKFDELINKDFKTAFNYIHGNKQTERPLKDYRFATLDRKDPVGFLKKVVERTKTADLLAFDIETHGTGYFDYKLLSIGLSWKEHTGISIPIWVKDDEKAAALQAVHDFKPKEHYKTENVVLKSGKTKEKKTKISGLISADFIAMSNLLPDEYWYVLNHENLAQIRAEIANILDKNPPMKKYWGENHDFALNCIKEIMENNTPKVAHNGSYDVNRLRGIGINVNNWMYDTIVMHHLLDEERPHGLDDLSYVYTQDGGYKSEKNVYLASSQTSWANIPLEVLLPYNAQDADVTLQLCHIFKEELQKLPKLWKLFTTLSMPAQRMLTDMSFRGSDIDLNWVHKTKSEYISKMKELKVEFQQIIQKIIPDVYVVDSPEEEKELTTTIKKQAKETGLEPKLPKFFNMNSNKQLLELFLDYYKAPLTKQTKSGIALDSEVLKKLQKKYPAASVLLEYKALKKIESTYLTGLVERIDSDKKIHTEYKLYGTTSGRLASTNPNCFDNQTEVLTLSGFKYFRDLKPTDLVAQWSDGVITFAKPLAYIKHKYAGNLIHIYNQHIDICGTDDHRCLLFNRKTKKAIVVPLKEYKWDYLQLHGGIYFDGTLSFKKPEIQLLVAVQADGYYGKTYIEFSFKKQRKIKRFKHILNELGITVEPKKRKNGVVRFTLSNKLPIVQLIRSIIPDKKFTYSLLNFTKECRDIFIEELNFWDGSYTRPLMYASKDKQNVDIVQTLLTMSNRRSCYRERTLQRDCGKRTYYYVDSTTKKPYSLTTNIKKDIIKYDDYVYCVTMPKDTVIIRRNGCIIMTKNCQNIPGEMKPMFIPPKGYLCVNVDQSAAELHVMAFLSKDRIMSKAFEDRIDLHKYTAASIFNKQENEISNEERQIAKKLNFMIAYSVSAAGLAEQLRNSGIKITDHQAEVYMNKWKARYHTCATYLENTKKLYKRYGFLETPFGRRRHKYKNFQKESVEAASLRTAQNFTIQSTASDIQLTEMVHMYQTLLDNGILPVFTVHDSIVMYCPYEKLEWLRDYYKQETCCRFSEINNCLMYTEMEVGRNYGEHVKLPYDCDFAQWKEEHKELFDENSLTKTNK